MLQLKSDVKQAAAVEMRRRFEIERRGRIFNPRQRLIGIDRETLDKQVEERKRKEEEEKQLNDAFDQQRIQNDKLALLMERTIEQERRKLNKEINEFRSVYQGPEARREFDLYDAYALKKSAAARVIDDDPRCGASSGQIFVGEDLNSPERLKAQKEQSKAWLEQQMQERENIEWERKCIEKAHDEALIAMDRRSCQIESLERKCRRRLDESLQEYNMLLAQERSQEVYSKEKKEQEANESEICHSMMGDLLCENRDVYQSNLGPNRVLGTMYKGMSLEERIAVRQAQMDQIEEKAKKKQNEDRIRAAWDDLSIGIEKQILLREKEMKLKQRKLEKEIVEQNRTLSEEQKARQDFLEKNVYTTKLTDEFYRQFNTSTR